MRADFQVLYMYALEWSRYAISKNGIFYCATTYCLKYIRVWNRVQRILLNFCWFSILFDMSITNISWTVAQTSISHIIFWKSVIRTVRCIYINYCNRLTFLPEVSTKLAKMHFFLRTITQEGNMKTRQVISFFSSTFSTLTICNIHFCIWIDFYVVLFWSILQSAS